MKTENLTPLQYATTKLIIENIPYRVANAVNSQINVIVGDDKCGDVITLYATTGTIIQNGRKIGHKGLKRFIELYKRLYLQYETEKGRELHKEIENAWIAIDEGSNHTMVIKGDPGIPSELRNDKEQLIRIFEILDNNVSDSKKINHIRNSMKKYKNKYFVEYNNRVINDKIKEHEKEIEKLKGELKLINSI